MVAIVRQAAPSGPVVRIAARPTVILASTSRYRAQQLAHVLPAFETVAPGIDEAPLAGEAVDATARRLAGAKAAAVAGRSHDALVIGADQLAELDGDPIGKPGDFERALAQLQRLRGREVAFHSAVCLHDTRDGRVRDAVVTTRVRFRDLPDDELAAYLRLDEPYDCAGSARSEGLGITIVERVSADDSSALIGLPLITLVGWLRDVGYPIYAR